MHMQYWLYFGMATFATGYCYLLINGLRVRKELHILNAKLESQAARRPVDEFESAYADKLHEGLKEEEANVKTDKSVEGKSYLAGKKNVTSSILLKYFIQQVAALIDRANAGSHSKIILEIIDGDHWLTFKDNLALLRIIFLLVEKTKQKKIEVNRVFVLAMPPLQLSILATCTNKTDQNCLYSLVNEEIRTSSSLQIILHETTSIDERLVIGVTENDDEDNSSRRPRNIQRKH